MSLKLRKRVAAALIVALALTPGVILAYQALLRMTGNFRTVIAGELYRSAQPTREHLQSYVDAAGIRTVINLRGAQPGAEWYDLERDLAAARHLVMIDFPMSAGEPLSAERAAELIALFRRSPKPILLHCKTGADRTGLASVIYASQVADLDEHRAEKELSPIYGHFGIPFFSPTYAMDRSWEALEVAFGIEGS